MLLDGDEDSTVRKIAAALKVEPSESCRGER
jgi:hypothetical protein